MSYLPESYGNKQPIRRLETQINNFNVAIPHHVNLLKHHKNNINKYQTQNDWEKVHKEHINVTRIIKQLKELMYQMDTLRAQVLDTDIDKFDKLTTSARSNILNAITEYLEMQLNLPTSDLTSSKDENQSADHPLDERYVQLHAEQCDLEHQQACLHGWNSLQNEMHQLQELFIDFNKIVLDQKELVNNAEDNVESTEVNVNEGNKYLEKAASYKMAVYPLAGALIGSCVGGPIGLIAGLKMGGLTALGGGLLGFTGGSLLKKKKIQMDSSVNKSCAKRDRKDTKSDLVISNESKKSL